MEQPKAAAKSKSKIMKFLPRAASSSVSFDGPPLYSPTKDKRSSEKPHKSNLGLGFSGPMVSIIPSDNRRKIIKNDPTFTLVYEPTSPRVSCMGTVKCKHYRKYADGDGVNKKQPPNLPKPTKKVSKTMSFNVLRTHHHKEDDQEKMEKVDEVVKSKKKIGIRSIFHGGASKKKSDEANNDSKLMCVLPRAPSVNTMKRFSSGRDAFKNFDWTTQVAPLNTGNRDCFTDDEKDGGSDGEEVIVPSSAPVMVRTKGICDNFVRGGGIILEPRKEINLWKRRTMNQPPPLQLHVA